MDGSGFGERPIVVRRTDSSLPKDLDWPFRRESGEADSAVASHRIGHCFDTCDDGVCPWLQESGSDGQDRRGEDRRAKLDGCWWMQTRRAKQKEGAATAASSPPPPLPPPPFFRLGFHQTGLETVLLWQQRRACSPLSPPLTAPPPPPLLLSQIKEGV